MSEIPVIWKTPASVQGNAEAGKLFPAEEPYLALRVTPEGLEIGERVYRLSSGIGVPLVRGLDGQWRRVSISGAVRVLHELLRAAEAARGEG